MGIGSTVECSFAALALCFSLLAHPCLDLLFLSCGEEEPCLRILTVYVAG